MIHHGRVCCIARRPRCEAVRARGDCPKLGVDDVAPARAARTAPASGAARPRSGATMSSRIAYRGRSIVVAVDEVALPNGRRVELDIVRHPGASAVVPFESPSATCC